MRPRLAKSGTIHIQHSLFATDERDAPTPPADDDTYEENRGKPGYPDMMPDEEFATTYEHLFTSYLNAYRKGYPVDNMLVSVAGGEYRRADKVLIISPDKKTHHGWLTVRNHAREQYEQEEKAKAQSLEDFGKTPHPDDLSAATGYTVNTEVAYEAMMDAIRDNIDPLMVEVKTDCGMYVRLCSCTVRSINDAPLSVFDVLKIVRMDRQDEILAARTEDESLVTDAWSM